MGSVGIEGISAMTCARLKASVSYSVPEEVMSFEVRNLKISGARGCFSSPADSMSVQQRWMKTRFSLYLLRGMSRNAPITASAEVELNSEKWLLANSTKKVRLESASYGSFKELLACRISLSKEGEPMSLSSSFAFEKALQSAMRRLFSSFLPVRSTI